MFFRGSPWEGVHLSFLRSGSLCLRCFSDLSLGLHFQSVIINAILVVDLYCVGVGFFIFVLFEAVFPCNLRSPELTQT